MIDMRTLELVDLPRKTNRFGQVEITVREARQLFKMMQQLEAIGNKKGIYVQVQTNLADIQDAIFDILNFYGRIELVGGSE